jgi:biopolymer transport protein ExbD
LYVKIKVPQASEVQKLEKKSLVSYINVGVPLDERKYGHEPRIQLNDQISEVSDIAEFIENERAARNEIDRPFLTTSIKADKDARMGIIVDIKQELRNVNALKLIYTTSRRGKE